jgi:hypothetical protein
MAGFTTKTESATSAERLLLCAILAQAIRDLRPMCADDVRLGSVWFFQNKGKQLEWMATALDLDYRHVQARIFEKYPDVAML